MAIRPTSYIPSFLKAALSGSRPLTMTFSEIQDTNVMATTSSFIYDPPGTPLKSTQQLNVDWSRFENHTFFMSAEAKTTLAFDQIINGYPFDGTRAEVERFFENLTGFDAWVFDSFPKFLGQLHFSGTQVSEDTDGSLGSWIETQDYRGALFPELAGSATGESVLNPTDKSMTIEMHLRIPSGTTPGTQVVCQKISGSTEGFALYLIPTSSTSNVEARFSVFSGSSAVTTSAVIEKGIFNHIAVELNRDEGVHFAQFVLNAEIVDTSRSKYSINNMQIDASPFTLGTGSAFNLAGTITTPTQTLSGTMDEFRLFHSARTTGELQRWARKSIFNTEDLKLYYRFNEPSGTLASTESDSINGIVIDGSGNSLHALISNFTSSLRQDAANDTASRMIYEKTATAPVLFPAHTDVIALNSVLVLSASEYDDANPNLITKLIPPHYLLEGAALEGFIEPEGGQATFGGSGIAGQGESGGMQLMLSFLYIYARLFDEMKLYLDAFSTLRHVDYETNETVPNNFILNLIDQFGFHLPPLFNDSTLEQYIRAENIDRDISTSELPLRSVQSELMRRVLVNLPDVLRSKGTQHAIRSFLRSIGIDPDNSMRIREFGGPTQRHLQFARETKREPNVMAEFLTSSLAVSPFLSASRFEVGYPQPAGTMVQSDIFTPHGISDNQNDGLLTSGSWTVETLVKWLPSKTKAGLVTTQSLVRLCVTGSNPSEGGVVANLLAMSSSIDPKVVLYLRPGGEVTSPLLSMSLSMPIPGPFDNNRWNLSFGMQRNDSVSSRVSSSYFLRVANQSNGEIEGYFATSSFFHDDPDDEGSVWRELLSTSSVSGVYLAVGENQSLLSGSAGELFLNDTSIVPDVARVTSLQALIARLRFWSKDLTEQEWREHIKNYKSTGVDDPTTNWNYSISNSGSFQRLRMDVIQKQTTRDALSTGALGEIEFLDFSENGFHLTGSGFTTTGSVLVGEIFDYSLISPAFDEASSNEKIRARSFQNQDLIDTTPWAGTAPIYELVRSERPTDDTRFVIEFSLVDALNRDIVNIFSVLDTLDNALGAPELVFSPDYPDLDRLRNIYFERIKDKLNFKSFFEFFRWFDTSIGTFIEQLIPRKVAFKGTNFVIESHILERHKLKYLSSEIYIGEADRSRLNDQIVLQQFAGSLKKY